MTTPHPLYPLRQLRATAPSGGQVVLIKFSESDYELSFYHGLLTASEDAVFWSAKLKAERGGIEKWQRAAAILTAGGWTVEALPCLSWSS